MRAGDLALLSLTCQKLRLFDGSEEYLYYNIHPQRKKALKAAEDLQKPPRLVLPNETGARPNCRRRNHTLLRDFESLHDADRVIAGTVCGS
jgi:hypothetical protein